MTLSGPKLGDLTPRRSDVVTMPAPSVSNTITVSPMPVAVEAPGFFDTIMSHPLILIIGLGLGGWLAHKHISPWGAIWGEQHAAHSRATALTGARRRKRSRR